MDSQSSSLSGFDASFMVLAAWDSHDFIPIVTAHKRFQLAIINVTVEFAFSSIGLCPYRDCRVFAGRLDFFGWKLDFLENFEQFRLVFALYSFPVQNCAFDLFKRLVHAFLQGS